MSMMGASRGRRSGMFGSSYVPDWNPSHAECGIGSRDFLSEPPPASSHPGVASQFRAGMTMYISAHSSGNYGTRDDRDLKTRIENDNFFHSEGGYIPGSYPIVLRPWPFSLYYRMGDEPPSPLEKNVAEILNVQMTTNANRFLGDGYPPINCVLETVEEAVTAVQEFSLLLEDGIFMEVIKVEHDPDYGVSMIVVSTGCELVLRHDKRVILGKLSRVICADEMIGG